MPNKSKFELNRQGLKEFKQQLAYKFVKAVDIEGVEEVREETKIWSRRLWRSTRGGELNVGDRLIFYKIIQGGVALPGELQQVGLRKAVDYALDVELRTGAIRGNVDLIGRGIVEGLHK